MMKMTKIENYVLLNPENIEKNISEIQYIDIGSIYNHKYKTTKINGDFPSRAKRVLRKGDTIISTVRPNLKGFTYIKDDITNLIGSTGFCVLRPKGENNHKFVYYLMHKKSTTQYLIKNSEGGVFPAFNTKVIEKMPVPDFTIKQQKSIASILSTQESLINEMEELIELHEKRLRYTSNELLSGRLRTKEVDGETVFYKNTEWKTENVNGKDVEIPEDWEKNTLINSYINNISTGIDKFSGTIKYYSTGAIINNKLENPEKEYFYDELPSRANLKVLNNSIYFARMQNTLKFLSFEKEIKDALLSTGFLGLKINQNYFNQNFVLFTIKTDKFQRVKNKNCFGGTQKSLNDGNAQKLEFIHPKLKEQQLIAEAILKQEELIQEQKELLELEKKRFTWLLENLLSGKYTVEASDDESLGKISLTDNSENVN